MFHRPPETEPQEPLTPDQEKVIAKFRRFSSVSMLIMFLGVAAVLGVIAYRMISAKSKAAGEVTALLPKGAKIVSTAVAGDLLVVTLDISGVTEIRTYYAATLAPSGRLRFAVEP